ncbi:hypothetical protein ABPG72_010807 [Tetrahymena utriculariae]
MSKIQLTYCQSQKLKILLICNKIPSEFNYQLFDCYDITLQLPPCFPDLNLIYNIWGLMKKKRWQQVGIRIGQSEIQSLGQEFQKSQNMKKLLFVLNNNFLDVQGGHFLGNSLAKCFNISHLEIDLSENNKGAQGITNLGEQIGNCQNLVSSNLNLNLNQIGDGQSLGFGQGLGKSNSISSLSIDFSHNYVNGFQPTYECLVSLSDNENLSDLTLSFNFSMLHCSAALGLGEGLDQLKKLTRLMLNLKYNQSNDYGVQQLAAGIRSCKNLKSYS